MALEDIAVIMVAPQMGENIGSMARAMKNFGLKELRIVNPRDGWPNERAYELAVSAKDLLDNIKVYNEFTESIADIETVYATSARLRNLNKPIYTPNEMVKDVVSFAKGKKLAILFGRENNGLDNHEISFADKLVTIPVSKELSSLNIAQSGIIIFYELFRQFTEIKPIEKEQIYASGDDVSGLFYHLENMLDKKGFFKVASKREGMILNIRSIFKRITDFSLQDVRTLRGIIRSLSGDNF